MKLFLTNHAVEQALARCGLSEEDLIREITACYLVSKFYRRHDEAWFPVEGYLGKGTAVGVALGGEQFRIMTVRDSNKFTQSERKDEKLTATLGEIIRRK